MSNKNVIYIILSVLMLFAIVLSIALVSLNEKAEPEAETQTPASQQVIITTITPAPAESEDPVITPPSQTIDPASGTDIVLQPTQRPSTDTDIP